jgi:uncharacterized membrane protein
MNSMLWAKLHGATTHFPIALVLVSVALDGAGFVLAGRAIVRDLHAAGYWTMLLAAIGSIGAVVSGLLMTKGSLLGHGALRLHHLFVWPSFALLVGLAVWRVIIGRRLTRVMLGSYLGVLIATAGLVSAAGYWGGELMIRA